MADSWKESNEVGEVVWEIGVYVEMRQRKDEEEKKPNK